MQNNSASEVKKTSDDCGVCGRPLLYETEETRMRCAFCGKQYTTLIRCPRGHYVCDECHRRGALEILREVLISTTDAAVLEILERVMSHPSVAMHGPEHHVMVPAILVAAARNAGYPVPERAVETAIARGNKIPGGWCGSHGACGAGLGVGIAVSVLSGATPLKGKPRALANEATAFVLGKMIDGQPRCCKRASRQAIEIAIEFLHTRMGIALNAGEKIKCRYVRRNRECIREDCPYFDHGSSSVQKK